MEGCKVKRNPHEGSSFDDFLREEGVFEEAEALAIKRVLAALLADAMRDKHVSKVQMGKLMGTSRSQLDRLLDPDNASITLLSLTKALAAVGKRMTIAFEDMPDHEANHA